MAHMTKVDRQVYFVLRMLGLLDGSAPSSSFGSQHT